MDDPVVLRPVSEDDLSWLAGLSDGPAATGPHEWHGWSDLQRERRQWAESGLLGDHGGTLVVVHGADRVGSVSWRRVQTGPTAFSWAIGVGLAPEFRGRGFGPSGGQLVTDTALRRRRCSVMQPCGSRVEEGTRRCKHR